MYYLYNGERLPELPEYDTAAYPYAVLDKTNTGASFLFYAFKSRPYYGTYPADSTRRGVYSNGGAKVYYFVPADGGNEWVHQMDTDNPFTAEDGNENTLFWTNTDILDEADGSVWLAASLPVYMADWRKSFLMGLAPGLTGKPLLYAKSEPVAYLYNGVRLPKLPDWDKETYPYAILIYHNAGTSATFQFYELKCFSQMPKYSTDSFGVGSVRYGGIDILQYKCPEGSAEWEHTYTGTATVGACYIASFTTYIWANFSIVNADNSSVFFEKSPPPVPVYE